MQDKSVVETSNYIPQTYIQSEKLERLKEERNRIINEHTTGSILVQDGKIYQGGVHDGKKPLSSSQAKVLSVPTQNVST